MKILVDMNLSPRLAQALADEGIEAVHRSSVGAFDAADGELMRHPRQHGFSVLTHDMDFGAMLAAILRFVEPDLEAGALVTVEPGKTRLRLLPLK